MDDHRNVSHVLTSLLNSLGLEEDHRQRRITCQQMTQVLASFYSPECPFMTERLSGSSYETTTIDGLSFDYDVMYIYKDLRAIAYMKDWRDDGIVTYLMDSKGCYSSFVKLYRLSTHYPELMKYPSGSHSWLFHETDTDGHILLRNTVVREFRDCFDMVEGGVHGPAYTSHLTGQEKDHVISLRCNFFPKAAAGWKQRQTPLTHTRIDPAIIDDINHCYLVAVGDKNSPTGHLQWRLTFTHIEHSLIHAWNNVQYQCYILMKFIQRDLIRPFVKESLSSYHLKTIMMWMNEAYPNAFFVSVNFDKCVFVYLRNLAAIVKKRWLPHYFVTECNLFHPKLTDHIYTARKLLAAIEKIVATWPRCLFRIRRCNLGKIFHDCLTLQSPLPMILSTIHNGRRVVGSRHELINELYNVECKFLVTRDSLLCQNTDVFKPLCKLREMTNNSNYSDDHRQFADFATKDILCNISLYRIRFGNTMPNKTALRNTTAGSLYIQRYSNSCCIDTALKIAAHFVMTGNHGRALASLDIVEDQMKSNTSYRCRHDQCKNFWCVGDTQMVFDKKPSMTEYCQHYIGDTVIYNKHYISHLPKGLVYEMFRSISVSPESKRWLYDWHEQAVIQCPVYLYYIRFLSHQQQGRRANRDVALDDMKVALKHVSKCTHRETNHNILGQCCTGNAGRAYKEYRKSLAIDILHLSHSFLSNN